MKGDAFKFAAPVRVTGGADRGASDWRDEEARAALAAEASLEAAAVSWADAVRADAERANGEPFDRAAAAAYDAAERAANQAVALPPHCRRQGVSVALGER